MKREISRKEKARHYFLGRDGQAKLNCGQAVAQAFSDAWDSSPDEVGGLAGLGGGKAPEGFCGAYYAARHLLAGKYPQKIAALEREFSLAAGSLKCKEIRGKNKLSCIGCVEKAADLLSRYIDNNADV